MPISQSSLLAAFQRKSLRDLLLAKTTGLDAAAHQSATSHMNLRRTPTDSQRDAGNYRKGHFKVAGLNITIENPAGTRRRPEWPILDAHYGYVRGSRGNDGDSVDVFVRPGTPADWAGPVYAIDQIRQGSGHFDEVKAMIGWSDQQEAVRAYAAGYTAGWKVGPVTEMTADAFRRWVLSEDGAGPASKKLQRGWKDRLARLLERRQG